MDGFRKEQSLDEIDDSEPDASYESTSDSELDPSRLGTKQYWDEVFTRDLKLYNETNDIGEIWFGYDSIKRVVDWVSKSSHITKESAILDIGCGNGMMVIELAKKGYSQLCGVDYAENAIMLAQSIAESAGVSVQFEVGNVLEDLHVDGSSPSCLHHQYDICLDKGTYDAISLNPCNSKCQRKNYLNSIQQLCRPNGLLIITSCNWTQQEIVEHFSPDFIFLERIPSPTFTFGGVTGSRETVLVLQRSEI